MAAAQGTAPEPLTTDDIQRVRYTPGSDAAASCTAGLNIINDW